MMAGRGPDARRYSFVTYIRGMARYKAGVDWQECRHGEGKACGHGFCRTLYGQYMAILTETWA